ncbi:MAG: glycosyltransferase family 4 protein [Phenylobacterium sp.]|nr:glycosyltransferase family 4 protein [Phenylobacterium sp.]
MGRTCVIVVENLPVPFDRRVWQEATALRDAGWIVTVICPLTQAYPSRDEVIDDIQIYRHPLPLEASGAGGFLLEYGAALFWEFRLLIKAARGRGFDVIHACNPPDLIFLAALPFKLLGKRFVFDHHDICPELYEAKFGKRGFFHALLVLFERLTFRMADLVISSNATFQQLAIDRGGKDPGKTVAVYSVPDSSRLRRVDPEPALRMGKRHLVGYVGIIGDQDGLDHFLRAVAALRDRHGRDDFHAVVVGDGPALAQIRALATQLGLDDLVTFTGYRIGDDLLRALSTFDIGVIPDPMNDYNDRISMNKVFEYSAFGVPTVAYPLTETRRLLGDVGTFAEGSEPDDLADGIVRLLDDDALRSERAAAALNLAEARFSWAWEKEKLVAAYDRLLPP